MPMRACVWGGRRESVSNQHFLVVVPQPIGFCILKKWAKCIACFIFPALNTPLSDETLPGKMQLPLFCLFPSVIRQKG